jgi:hypothetical protein
MHDLQIMQNGIWVNLTKIHFPAKNVAAISKQGGCASLYLYYRNGTVR